MQVNVNNIKEESDYLSVTINGECNHESVVVSIEDFGYPDARIGDWVDDERQVIECTKCHVWRNSIEEDWEGVPFLPEPYITNNGKLVLR